MNMPTRQCQKQLYVLYHGRQRQRHTSLAHVSLADRRCRMMQHSRPHRVVGAEVGDARGILSLQFVNEDLVAQLLLTQHARHKLPPHVLRRHHTDIMVQSHGNTICMKHGALRMHCHVQGEAAEYVTEALLNTQP